MLYSCFISRVEKHTLSLAYLRFPANLRNQKFGREIMFALLFIKNAISWTFDRSFTGDSIIPVVFLRDIILLLKDGHLMSGYLTDIDCLHINRFLLLFFIFVSIIESIAKLLFELMQELVIYFIRIFSAALFFLLLLVCREFT